MNWLDHNPIADMYGPSFLLLYAILSVLTIGFCRWWVRSIDQSSFERPMLIPENLDPGEAAYLRGGANEVIRLMIFDLTERGYLEIDQNGRWIAKRRKHIPTIQSAADADLTGLTSLEQNLVTWFQTARTPNEVFQSPIVGRIQEHYGAYEEQLRGDNLIAPNGLLKQARSVIISGDVFLISAGLYKCAIALSHGFSNIGFLIIMTIIAGIALPLISKPPRLTRRGRDYVSRLQSAFGGINHVPSGAPAGGALVNPMVLSVAVFGFAALDSSPYSRYKAVFAQGAQGAAGGSCGGACGSASTGGCGGAGGGCGGGGGGCGGCGGGG